MHLEHGNMLLHLENSVMGERLKSLYASLDEISVNKAAGDLYRTEICRMAEVALEWAGYVENLEAEIEVLTRQRDQMQTTNIKLAGLREDDRAEKTKLAAVAKDRLQQLQAEVVHLSESKALTAVSLEKHEKKLKEFADENDRLRQKMKNSRLKRKANESTEEICRVCQKLYSEMENFNWSCRTHYGEFSGEMWWCCGKPGREALGCRLARHLSKEDEDMEPQDSVPSDLLCASCKGLGHRHADCPKDPNIRSKQDLGSELRRLHDIRERKKYSAASSSWHDAAVSHFKEKYGQSGFGKEEGSEGSSDSEPEEWVKLLRRRKTPKMQARLAKLDTLAAVS